ncbi:MAG: hypothetical protein IT260_09985 [Saprospiraceae bacterium]|nr:hypothetical protein [Saprospiraceae bacterium]
MAKRGGKNFKNTVVAALDEAQVEMPVLEQILNGIPIAGDDILAELLDATSDRTVEPAALAVAEIVAAPGAETPEALPEDLGEETGAQPEFIERVEAIRQKGARSLTEAEEIAKREMPQNTPEGPALPSNPPVEASSAGSPPADTPPLTALDSELNSIAAQELVDWYDILQSVLAVWSYDFFSTPKKAVQTVEELYPKIAAGKANPGEKALYEKAQEAVLGFTKRKTSFAEQVAMSEGLKQRTMRLLDKILEARQVRIPPELLLGFLLLTPLVVNGGKILLEKIGFNNADSILDKFTTFVNTQEAGYWNDKQPSA